MASNKTDRSINTPNKAGFCCHKEVNNLETQVVSGGRPSRSSRENPGIGRPKNVPDENDTSPRARSSGST